MIREMPKDTPPMHAIRTGVSALGCFDTTCDDDSQHAQRRKALRLIAQIPVVTAYFHRHRQGKGLVHPDKSLGEAANFLYMINGEKPSKEGKHPRHVLCAARGPRHERLDVQRPRDHRDVERHVFRDHDRHRHLKGPLHGGANEGVIKMLQEIGSLDKVDAWLEDCSPTSGRSWASAIASTRCSTRARRISSAWRRSLCEKLGDKKWIQMSERIAETMLAKKNLHANVDFYSATVYYSLGIPTDLFTPIFAIARTSGWTAHVLEQLADNRLIRPQSVYTGPVGLKVVPVEQR
jgi:citrate synthase